MKLNAVRWMAAAAAVVMAALNIAPAAAQTVSINGAGASFPFPVYGQWAHKYNQLTGVQVNYQSIGSGGGIAQIKAKTVDFGASDDPLKTEELNQAGLLQFPMIMGGVVPIINVKGIEPGKMLLTNALVADIFLGKVNKWNDPAIVGLNPGLQLPEQKITVVRRADGSGTTSIFTNYLAKVSPEWKDKIGAGKTVEWPVGVGGKGNEGVSAYVRKVNGSIGYVEYAYALQNKLSHVKLRNRDGGEVEPTSATFQAAAANAEWKAEEGFGLFLTDQPGKESWPITGVSYILIYKQHDKADIAAAMLKFFDWAYKHGKETAEKLHYVAMPENVIQMVQAAWAKDVTAGGKPGWPAN
ncbi:phosphate ABC transporter substrate-binding protein PstS [Candidatus Electronema sp. PJ]|uniref:phosphate ABC transporter substrate-binding protein PstS n=1 Tax=Candidatus Electronema sp. PJ TaxID=3401572 RepID=UPI003AA852C3